MPETLVPFDDVTPGQPLQFESHPDRALGTAPAAHCPLDDAGDEKRQTPTSVLTKDHPQHTTAL